jgi:uncharacterized protein DUF3592
MARRRIGFGWSIVLLVCGVIATPITLYVFSLNKPYEGGVAATGTVTSLHEQRWEGKHPRTTYERTVTFLTREGREITFDAQGYSSIGDPHIGERVEVSYRPEDPEAARLIVEIDVPTTLFDYALTGGSMLMALAGVAGLAQHFFWRRRPVRSIP